MKQFEAYKELRIGRSDYTTPETALFKTLA